MVLSYPWTHWPELTVALPFSTYGSRNDRTQKRRPGGFHVPALEVTPVASVHILLARIQTHGSIELQKRLENLVRCVPWKVGRSGLVTAGSLDHIYLPVWIPYLGLSLGRWGLCLSWSFLCPRQLPHSLAHCRLVVPKLGCALESSGGI